MAHPADRFAAFAAHSLNEIGPDGKVRVEAGALYVLWLEALATRYSAPLLQHLRYAQRMDADEAAERYFRATLERGLFQAAQSECTVAHTLFLALCRRGEGEWPSARIERRLHGAEAPAALRLPPDWKAVTAALAACDQGLSTTNAASSHRARFGPMVLACGAAVVALPEQMSVWDAVRCAPRTLAQLSPGPAFNAFCSAFINALRTTNRPFQEVLSLGRGLCPFDWLDLPVNQVRGVGRFLHALEERGGGSSEESWVAAWGVSPVPGYKSSAAFRGAELGQALWQAAPATHVEADPEMLGAEDEAYESLMEAGEFRHAIESLLQRQRISAAEGRLLLGLYDGAALEALVRDAQIAALFAGRSAESALAALQRRVETA